MIIQILGWPLALTLIFGCSTSPVKWYKPGVSQAAFSKDRADCENALLATGTTETTQKVYSLEGCLEGKGYRAIPASAQ